MSKILCVDFDGVLHSYESGWQGADVIADEPVPGAIDFVRTILRAEGYKLAIYSSRSKTPEGVLAMRRWLFMYLVMAGESETVAAAMMDHIDFPTQKPPAYLTIDDRAICFTGEFPTIAEMDAFKPWNKT